MLGARDRRPIFVHASQRSGSTYFFSVLRRMEPLLCFDEAITDSFTYYGKNDIARRVRGGKWNASHYFLKHYSQAEFIDAWDHVMHLYPAAPAFRDYVPRDGILSSELERYVAALIEYAWAKGKRATLCEIFSRGRVGVLRQTFGGYHIAQYRDPLSQFGSSFRALQELGQWTFILIPLQELGPSGQNPFYSLIPEAWRVPVLPWPADDRAQRWASTEEYISMILSLRPDALERIFRWHLLSWFFNNLAAIIYSDSILDIDRAHDDLEYRASTREALHSEIGVPPDFTDIAKFSRHYRFEGVDIARICNEIIVSVRAAQKNSQLDAVIRSLGRGPATFSATTAINVLAEKIRVAITDMSSADTYAYVSRDDWKNIVQKNRHLWAHRQLRTAMRHLYPFALPVVQAARTIGIMR